MTQAQFALLFATLRARFGLSKPRLETLCVLIIGVVQARTVNLSHIASHFPGAALQASNDRRLQRFFQHERLDGDAAAQLIMQFPGCRGRWHLVLDRTHWRLGMRDINMLVLAVVTRRFRVPVMWAQLGRSGAPIPVKGWL